MLIKRNLSWIGKAKRVDKVQDFDLAIGGSVVRPSASARNLGVLFDNFVV